MLLFFAMYSLGVGKIQNSEFSVKYIIYDDDGTRVGWKRGNR